MITEAGKAMHGIVRHSTEPCSLARTIEGIEIEAAREERTRLGIEFFHYWDWLVQQPLYGNGGGWGEAAMSKVASLLTESQS